MKFDRDDDRRGDHDNDHHDNADLSSDMAVKSSPFITNVLIEIKRIYPYFRLIL